MWRRNDLSEEERWEQPVNYNFQNLFDLVIKQKPFHSVETIGSSVWDGVFSNQFCTLF